MRPYFLKQQTDMENRMFTSVPIMIEAKEYPFNFIISENAYGLTCKIYAEGCEALIDKDFFIISGNMADNWIAAAVKALYGLLEEETVR